MAENSLARKTAIGATWMIAWRFVTRVLGLASTLALARILVPADFGIVAMASVFSGAVDALSQLGLQDALVRHPDDDRRLFDTAFTLQVARALAIGGVIAAGAPVAAWWFEEPRLVPVLLVLAALAALGGFENIGIIEFRRSMRYDKQFVFLSVPRLVQVAVTIPLAFALQSYWALLIGIAAGKVTRLAVTYAVHPYRPSLRLAGWQELAGFSFWTWATSMVNLVWEKCDSVVLGPKLGPAGLGVYLLALEMAVLPVTELIAPAADALFAGFASAQKHGSRVDHTPSGVAVTLLLGVAPLAIALSATAGYVGAALLGPKWITAQPLIAIMAWQCVFSPFSYVCSTLLVARGLVKLNFLGNVAAAVVKLVATLIVVSLAPRLETVAIVIVFVVGAEAVAFMALMRRAGGTGLRGNLGPLLRIAVAGAVTTAALWFSGYGWQPVTMPALQAFLTGSAIGCAGLAVFGAVDLLLWLAAGRGAGPEARFLDLAGQFANRPSLRRRLGIP